MSTDTTTPSEQQKEAEQERRAEQARKRAERRKAREEAAQHDNGFEFITIIDTDVTHLAVHNKNGD